MAEKIFEVAGNADELMVVDDTNGIKSTRLFHLGMDMMDSTSEIIDVQITSTNPEGETPIFDRLFNNKIRVTVEVLDGTEDLN